MRPYCTLGGGGGGKGTPIYGLCTCRGIGCGFEVLGP